MISDSIQTPKTANDDATATSSSTQATLQELPLISDSSNTEDSNLLQATSPRTSASLISDSIQTPKTANDDATAVPLLNLLKQQVQEIRFH